MSVKVTSWIWENSQHKGSALMLLLAIADAANDDGIAWPGLANLSKKTRLDRRYLIELVKELEASGAVVVKRRRDGKVNKSNIYQIVMAEPVVIEEALPSELQTTTPSEPQNTRVVFPSTPEPLIKHKLETLKKRNGSRKRETHPPEELPVKKAAGSERYSIAQVLAEVCHMDFEKNKGLLLREAKNFTSSDIARIRTDYGPEGAWFTSDFRGLKHEPPTPSFIRQTWGRLIPASNAKTLAEAFLE